jgi:cytochrome d ubiquinol oxidase subunit I
VNAWMNNPTGFTIRDGVVTDVDPLAAMFND